MGSIQRHCRAQISMSARPGIIEHDFAIPFPHNSDVSSKTSSAWSLQDTSSNIRTLVPLFPTRNATYKFISPKPSKKNQIEQATRIERDINGQKSQIASMHFSPDGKKTKIHIVIGGMDYTIAARMDHHIRYSCTLGGEEVYWQLLGPSHTVLELVRMDGWRLAVFVYTSDPAQHFDPASGLKVKLRRGEIGVLHIAEGRVGKISVEDVLLTGIGVVVMRKGRN